MGNLRSLDQENDVLTKVKILQEMMRDPKVLANQKLINELKGRYESYVNQVANEMNELIKYQFAKLTDLENIEVNPEKAPKSHNDFSNVCNRLNALVANNILQNATVADRTMAKEFWVGVLQKSLELGNISATQSIYAALTMSRMENLVDTHEGLSAKAKEFLSNNILAFVANGANHNLARDLAISSDSFGITPLHATFKALMTTLTENYKAFKQRGEEKKDDADKTLQQMHDHVFMLKQFRNHRTQDVKLSGEASMSPLQKQLISSAAMADPNNFTYKESNRGNEASKPYDLLHKEQYKSFTMQNADVKIADPGVQTYLAKYDRRFKVDKMIRDYISEYKPEGDRFDPKANRDPKELAGMPLSERRAILLDDFRVKLNDTPFDDDKLKLLQDFIKNADASFYEHHRSVSGLAKSAVKIDTKPIKMLKELYSAIDDLQKHNNLMKEQIALKEAAYGTRSSEAVMGVVLSTPEQMPKQSAHASTSQIQHSLNLPQAVPAPVPVEQSPQNFIIETPGIRAKSGVLLHPGKPLPIARNIGQQPIQVGHEEGIPAQQGKRSIEGVPQHFTTTSPEQPKHTVISSGTPAQQGKRSVTGLEGVPQHFTTTSPEQPKHTVISSGTPAQQGKRSVTGLEGVPQHFTTTSPEQPKHTVISSGTPAQQGKRSVAGLEGVPQHFTTTSPEQPKHTAISSGTPAQQGKRSVIEGVQQPAAEANKNTAASHYLSGSDRSNLKSKIDHFESLAKSGAPSKESPEVNNSNNAPTAVRPKLR